MKKKSIAAIAEAYAVSKIPGRTPDLEECKAWLTEAYLAGFRKGRTKGKQTTAQRRAELVKMVDGQIAKALVSLHGRRARNKDNI